MENTQQELKIEKKKYYPVLDLVRFIAALIVISIHIFPEGSTVENVGLDNSVPTLVGLSFMNALLRVAVPIFFVISSFLIFKKIKEDQEHKWRIVGKFCLRILFFYLFWYVIGLPITIRDITGFISQGDTSGLIRYVIINLVKGAPRGYWFLVSLVFSIFIVAFCNSKKSMTILLIVSGLLYIYGCFNSAYFGVFKLSDNSFFKGLVWFGEYLNLSYCHLEALIYVAIGKVFAKHNSFKIKGNIYFIPILFLLMVGELFLTMFTNIHVYPEAFFSLPIFIFFLMNYIFTLDSQNEKFIKVARKLKKVGSFSYLFHIQFFYYMHLILDSTGSNIFRELYGLLIIPYLICILLSFGLQSLCEYLSKYKFFGFLKNSY